MELKDQLLALQGELKTYVAKATEEKTQYGTMLSETKTAMEKLQAQLDGIDIKLAAKHANESAGKSLVDTLKENDNVARMIKDRSGRAVFSVKGADLERKTTITSAAVGAATSGVLQIDRIPGKERTHGSPQSACSSWNGEVRMRNLDPTFQAELSAAVIEPVIFAALTFRTKTCYVCSAGYSIRWQGNTFQGVGTLGGISAVRERTELKADGITLTLSGIDPTILAECLTDIQPLQPAKLHFGLVKQGQMIGTPYCFFAGVVDKPTFAVLPESVTMSLALESRMVLLNRPSQRRYTSADQHAFGYADDSGFAFVEKLNDIALRWGT